MNSRCQPDDRHFGRHASTLQSLSLIILLMVSSSLGAEIEVRPVRGSVVEARTGSTITLGFHVTNVSARECSVRTTISLPAGWRIVVPDGSFLLGPRASDLRLVTIALPVNVEEGAYPIEYVARPAGAASDSTIARIEVRVPAARRLEVEVLEAPRDVTAGSTFRILYRVANRGNCSETIRLRGVSLDPDFTLQLDRTTFRLAPQEVRDAVLEIATPSKAGDAYLCRIDLIAQLQSDSTVARQAASIVRLLPRPEMAEVETHSLPLTARLRWGGEGDRSGAQVELAGGGSLRADGSDHLDLIIRTPDLQPTTLLGYRDEYRLEYSTDDFQAYIGDRNFVLSPLTEFGRYAFGGGGGLRTGKLSIAAFANRDRFLSSHPTELAASTGYAPSPLTQLSVNYFHRVEETTSDIVTARGIFRNLWKTEGEVEIGRDFGDGGDNALALHWSGWDRWGSFAVRHVRAGSGYDAYYKDIVFTSASVNFRQTWPLRFDANYRDDSRNLDLDTNRRSAPRSTYFDAGIGYREYLTVAYRYNEYRDELPGSQFSRTFSGILIQAGYNWPALGVLGQFHLGTERDRQTGGSSLFRRYALISSITPSMYHSYGFTVEYERSNDLLTGEPLERLSGSARAGVNLPGGTRVSAQFYSGRSLTERAGSFTYLDLSAEQLLPFGHTIAARARRNIGEPAGEREELSYILEYAVPFAIPLKTLPTAGAVRGSLRDALSGVALKGAVLTLDYLAVLTDESGEFLFPDVKSGTHVLDVDQASIPRGFVSVPQLPLEVTVVNGEIREVSLAIVQGGTVAGVVMVDTTTALPGTPQVRPGDGPPLPDLILELTSGEKIFRQRSGSDGRFGFQGVPPGEWHLRVLPGSLPSGYVIEADTAAILLGPGERREIPLRARPIRRQIRMLDEGKVLIDTSAATHVSGGPGVQPVPLAARSPSAFVARGGDPPRFSVQISSWRKKRTATREADRYARLLGVNVNARESRSKDGQTWYRVIAGPLSTKGEADMVAEKLKKG